MNQIEWGYIKCQIVNLLQQVKGYKTSILTLENLKRHWKNLMYLQTDDDLNMQIYYKNTKDKPESKISTYTLN